MPTLKASTVPRMKEIVRSGGGFPRSATVALFGLPTAWTFELNEGIRRELVRLTSAIDRAEVDLVA